MCKLCVQAQACIQFITITPASTPTPTPTPTSNPTTPKEWMDTVIVETKAFDDEQTREAELAHLSRAAASPSGIPDTVLRSKVGYCWKLVGCLSRRFGVSCSTQRHL